MRINRNTLLKNARNTVAERLYQDRSLVCVYLTDSLLSDEILLGGATDIDLIIVHGADHPIKREIVRITDEVHLDIAHKSQQLYSDTRKLRIDPWLGPFLCKDPLVLHDRGHWFDFTQASVCAHFKQADNVLQRAKPLVEDARRRWFSLVDASFGSKSLLSFLKALENAANAIATLSGVPLTERRFIISFPQRAEAIRRPGLASGLNDLFASEPFSASDWQDWIAHWQQAYKMAGEDSFPFPDLHPCRQYYYQKAAEALLPDHPEAALWLLLRTWTLAVTRLPEETSLAEAWQLACQKLALGDENFQKRVADLDIYLDNVEDALDNWAQERGISPLTDLP